MQRTHDMGGLAAGPVDTGEHPMEPWQKTTRAMRQVLGDEKRGLIRVDELRRAIEDLPPDQYNSLAYFDRWIRAVRTVLVEKGVVDDAEIEARMAELRARRKETRHGG